MMNIKDLKSCPFCGSKNLVHKYVYIQCDNCLAEGPGVNNKRNDDHVDYVDAENAAKLWNQRKV